jgi:gamma-glutamylcysteine synthetase
MEKIGGRVVPATGTFAQWLAAHPEPEGEGAFEAFLYHEHYIWSSARARAVHGTIEMRAACQQPHGEAMVASALGFAMMEAGAELAAWLEAELGAEAWPAMRAWHHEVIHHGLRASPPFPGLLEGLLQRCEAALERRGRGEERLLAPLWGRLALRQNPADAALAVYEAGGMPALIGHLSAGA